MISVMFDSNVYRRVLIPTDFPKDPCIKEIININSALSNKKLKGYLSEVIFQIEAIPKNKRNTFYKDFAPKTNTDEKIENGKIDTSLIISPSANRIQMDSYRAKYLNAASKLDVKIIRNNRIGMPLTQIPDAFYLNIKDSDEFHKKNDKCGELNLAIAEKNVGFRKIENVCIPNAPKNKPWFYGLENTDSTQVKKAFSEWADGDAISQCYGYEIDYFCTEDCGNSASGDSILSQDNKKWLQDNFGINIINLKDLSNLLS